MLDREQLLDDCLDVKRLLTDTTQEDAEVAKLEAELTSLVEQIEQMIRNNASKEQDQGEYTKHFDEISSRYERVKST